MHPEGDSDFIWFFIIVIIALLFIYFLLQQKDKHRPIYQYQPQRTYLQPARSYNQQLASAPSSNNWQSHGASSRGFSEVSHRVQRSFSFHTFIQRVVDKFKGQRMSSYQFAVLFLSPKNSLGAALNDIREKILDSSYPTTDNTKPTFPTDTNLCDFITARPDELDHAEKLIMDKFYALARGYRQKMPPCKFVILYTWLFPCSFCTGKIIEKLSSYGSNECKVIVVHTSNREADNTNYETNVKRLEEAGIELRKEKFDEYLDPA